MNDDMDRELWKNRCRGITAGKLVDKNIMKTQYKHICFEIAPGAGTTYICRNYSGEILGYVGVYDEWKQFCFYSKKDIILSKSCLLDIADFLNQLTV